MPIAKPLHIRLFMEGEEVPVVSAQVSININGPSTASIQIVPLDESLDFKPRTMVHLFFYDEKVDTSVATVALGATADFKISGKYRLQFLGEAIGFSMLKSASSRGLVLQCVDFSNYWDSAHATVIQYGPNGNVFHNKSSLFSGDSSLFDDIGVSGQSNRLVQWLKQRPVTPGLTSVSGLAGGIIRVMEAVGGVIGSVESGSRSRGINDFFTVAELRCRLLQQVTAEENDNTASNLLSAKVFDEFLRNSIQNAGTHVTFRQLMLLLFSKVFYDFVPNPAPKFEEMKKGKSDFKVGPKKKIKETPTGLAVVRSLNNAQSFLRSGATGDGVKSVAANAVKELKKAQINLDALKRDSPSVAKDVTAILNKLLVAVNTTVELQKNGGTAEKVEAAAVKIGSVVEFLNSTETTTSIIVDRTSSTAQRLRAQIIRPDCWFSAPPRCNVIFPEMYTQLSYDRNWVSEVTRTLLFPYATLVGKDAMLSEGVFSPPLGLAARKILKQGANTNSYRVLMDHEIHTGIVPRSEWISNTMALEKNSGGSARSKFSKERLTWASKVSLFHFFKYRLESRQVSILGRYNPGLVCGFPGVVIQTPFSVSDEVLAGLSISSDNDFIEKLDKVGAKVKVPQQLVGMITSVSHNIDQNGGTTQVSLDRVRRHSGVDDEFINILFEKRNTSERIVKYVITSEAAEQDVYLKKLLIKATPQITTPVKNKRSKGVKKKAVLNTKSIVSRAAGFKELKSNSKSHFITFEVSVVNATAGSRTTFSVLPEIKNEEMLVPLGKTQLNVGDTGKYNGKIVGIEVLDNGSLTTLDGKSAFTAIVIYEKLSIPVEQSIPFEDIVRPSWFSSSYANKNISKKIYQPFFGCSSVVDDLTLVGELPEDVNFAGEDPSPEYVLPEVALPALMKKLTAEESDRTSVSVEKAVTVLSYLYGRVKKQGLDVEEFIRAYTDRPIATMEQVLGSPDLELAINGNNITVSKGSLGFHTTAVNRAIVTASEKNPLIGLVDDPLLEVARINGEGTQSTIYPAYDVRLEKKLKVIDYITALSNGPAFRG